MIIEEAFTTGETHAMLDDYHIDFKHNRQISNNDTNKQRPVKRMVNDKNDTRWREERFLPNPVAPDRPYGDQYGFIPPFIKEVVKHLNLTKKQLPSKNETVVPMILEKAALGIIEEGKEVGKQREAEKTANLLMDKRNAGIKEIWKCCAYLYSFESFLYKKLNEIMRLIGSEQHEQVWRSKVCTLGPFCLLLWDNPFNSKMIKPGTILYRGANLSDDLIASFKDDCSKHPKPWRTFQAFTSCSRTRSVAQNFDKANVLFIMNTQIAFTADISSLSEYRHEDEELLFPGVSFIIDRVEFDKNKSKHVIYLTLRQRHSSKTILSFYQFSQPSLTYYAHVPLSSCFLTRLASVFLTIRSVVYTVTETVECKIQLYQIRLYWCKKVR
jgi:hypothetical protein